MVTMMQRINWRSSSHSDNQVVTCATCFQPTRAEPRLIPPMEVAAHGASDEEGKPPALTVKQILDKWVQASGRRAGVCQKLRTRVTSGSFAGMGRSRCPGRSSGGAG